MTSTVEPVVNPSTAPATLSIVIRAKARGQILTSEPVTGADLIDIRAEAWRECVLRHGHTKVPFAPEPFRLTPILRPDAPGFCSGFAIEGTLPNGATFQREFSTRCLKDAAHRAADRLVSLNILEAGQTFVFEVQVDEEPPRAAVSVTAGGLDVTVRTPPLRPLSVPLRGLLQQARAENLEDDSVHPVFITEEALRSAERFSRKGASANPPVETGAALAGVLCSSPCGEFFSVITDALEAVAPENSEFSLEFSSTSWRRIQRVVEARQTVQPAFRMLGNCHGHNFLPNAGKTCEACPTRVTCDLTNLFVSSDDRTWTRAVFSRQPWGLCLIFGLTARGDALRGLWGLEDGRLRERGFFILPEFDPDHWQLKP